jgi:hypothetical protein
LVLDSKMDWSVFAKRSMSPQLVVVGSILRQDPSLDHILRDAGLSDLKAELEQLAVDARRSPQRIVNAHPSDQRAQVCVDLRPTSKGVGFPTPVPAEAGSVPSHQGLGPDNRDGVEDCRKPPIQLDEEQTITIREPDTATHLPPQYD